MLLSAISSLVFPLQTSETNKLEVPKDMKLFLLVGQSNMAGRGKIEPSDQVTNPRILMLNKKMEWVLAKDPVHFDKPGMAKVGLCSEFARMQVGKDDKIVVGLIPCAFGGTKLDQWMPSDKPNSLYRNAIDRAKLAMQSGTLAGILWHQGESDSEDPKLVETYAERFALMMVQMRKDLNAENVPVIVGELRGDVPFNKVVRALPDKVPRCAWVSSEGLGSGDVHFDAEGYRTLGKRYADKYFTTNNME